MTGRTIAGPPLKRGTTGIPAPRSAVARFSAVTVYRFVVVVIYTLPLLMFTSPNVDAAAGAGFLDQWTKVKVAILAFAVLGGAILIFNNRRSRQLLRPLHVLAPFIVFGGWSIVTSFWSPLKSVSVGKAGELCAQLMLCWLIACVCQDKRTTSRILRHLCYSFIGCATAILVAFAIDPAVSGLDRTVLYVGGDGIVHPTASGASASLGLLIATVCWVIGRFPWATRALVLSFITNGALLYLSNSRAAIVMAALTITAACLMFASSKGRGWALLGVALIALTTIAWDPGFEATGKAIDSVVAYLARGQDLQQIQNVSGRAEMWTAIWREFTSGRYFGHGYFVTSPTGELLVWNVVANHTAHNVYLQVLVSTGLVGMVIFIAAVLRILFAVVRLKDGDLFSQHLFWMLCFFILWYLGWTLGCISFMGPVRTESVAFYSLAGIAIGEYCRIDRERRSRIVHYR